VTVYVKAGLFICASCGIITLDSDKPCQCGNATFCDFLVPAEDPVGYDTGAGTGVSNSYYGPTPFDAG